MSAILLKRTKTPGRVPVSLRDGELYLNEADGKLFWKDSDGITTPTPLRTNVANGLLQLDGSSQVPISLLPPAIAGAMQYKGLWNAATNTPTLVSSVGSKGFYYKVSVRGTTSIDGINVWNVGDEIIFDGTTWDRLSGGQPGIRVAVADANHTFVGNEELVAYTSITTPRAVTLPLANTLLGGTRRYVMDESGSCSPTNFIVVGGSGSDTVNFGTFAVLSAPRAAIVLETDGVSKWTVIAQPAPRTIRSQGRLTLASGTPVMTAAVAAAAVVYYTPYEGNIVPIWDGEGFVPTSFAELANILANSAVNNAGPFAASANAAYDLYAWRIPISGAVALTRSDMWQQTGTVSGITNASPAVVTRTAHGLLAGAPVRLSVVGGSLPPGFTAGVIYYVVAPTANTYQLSATVGGAPINAGGAASGTITATEGIGVASLTTNAVARGAANAQSRVTGILVNAVSIANGPAAGAGTYVGTVITDATGATVSVAATGLPASNVGRGMANASDPPIRSGLLIARRIFAPGTYVYKETPGTNFIVVKGQAGGASGGGCAAAAAGQVSIGSGGGGGGYFEKLISSGFSGQTITVGTGGAAAAAGGAGNVGGTTSFGFAIATAGGGVAGQAGTSAAVTGLIPGGAGGTATGGDINILGQAGEAACYMNVSIVQTPAGGDSYMGLGSASTGTGTSIVPLAPSGYGAGSGGAAACAGNPATASIAARDGIMIIEEYA